MKRKKHSAFKLGQHPGIQVRLTLGCIYSSVDKVNNSKFDSNYKHYSAVKLSFLTGR